MKMVNSLLLTAAAGLVAVSGAQAADLPVKAKPVEYVKVCSLYGVGYYYIPGTDICMKLGGYVRWQESYNPGSTISGGPFNGAGGRNTRADSQDWAQRTRAVATFDTRQQTSYGTLRTYLLLGYSQDSTVAPTTSPTVYMTRGFIQFAGFTFGKATSFFDFFSSAAVSYNAGMLHNPDTGDAGQMVVAYTAQLGNGMSATIAAEQTRRAATVQTNNLTGAALSPYVIGALPTANDLAGITGGNTAGVGLQDIVGNIRVDQAWGAAQFSAALHDVSAAYYNNGTGAEVNGSPGNKWGWAVSPGLRLNAPMIGPGDYFQIAAVFAQGATKYTAGATPTGTSGYNYFSGNSVGFGFWEDAVFAGAVNGVVGNKGSIELTTSWAIHGSYEHFWTPSLRTSVYGSYVDIKHSAAANDAICRSSGAVSATNNLFATTAGAVAAGCTADFSAWNVGTRSQWNITKDLYIGIDVIYLKLNTAQANATNTVLIAANGAKPAGTYKVEDQDAIVATWRIHRDIVP